ncbi:MAG: hypothetical protein AAB307_01785 [Deltaproteobacteria bacterium]
MERLSKKREKVIMEMSCGKTNKKRPTASGEALTAQDECSPERPVWLPECASSRHGKGQAEPEVYFRIVHVTPADNNVFSTYHEQTVEITLGPKGAFESENIGVIKRRVSPDGVVNALPLHLSKPKHQKIPKTPRVAELIRKAIEWKELIESGKGITQADIASREGLSRARVT